MNRRGRWSFVPDRILVGSSYLYLGTPIAIFLLGWLRLPIALLSVAALLLGLSLTLRKFEFRDLKGALGSQFLVGALLLALIWVGLSGIGGFGYQNADFSRRNAVFRDLIDHAWPVLYDCPVGSAPQSACGSGAALVYYFTYWLPAALVGKVAGWQMANLVLFGWTVLGVSLCMLLLARYVGRDRLLIVVAFAAWSGLDIIGTIVTSWGTLVSSSSTAAHISAHTLVGRLLALTLNDSQLEWWAGAGIWQYSSFTTQLFWVFNSSVPAWLTTLLLLNQEDAGSLVFTYVLVLFFAPLPGVGLLPYLIFKLATRTRALLRTDDSHGSPFQSLKSILTLQNTIVPLALTAVAIPFFGIQAGNNPHGFIWQFVPFTGARVGEYFLFCLLEFGLFSLFVLKKAPHRPLIALSMVVLAVLPLLKYADDNDLMTRASIPPLLILFAVGFRNIMGGVGEVGGRMRRVASILLVVVLLLGSVTPLHELARSRDAIVAAHGFPPADESIGTFQRLVDRQDFKSFPQIAGNARDAFFFKVLAPPISH